MIAIIIILLTLVVAFTILAALRVLYLVGKTPDVKHGICYVYEDNGEPKCIWVAFGDLDSQQKIERNLYPVYYETWNNDEFVERVDCHCESC
jgi:hypothetical protein